MHDITARQRSQRTRPRLAPRQPPEFGNGLHDELPTRDARGDPYPRIRPTDLPIDIILRRLRGVTGCGPTWRACCPGHADSRPSLALTETDDHTLCIYCHAGCQPEAIMAAIGLRLSHLYPSRTALHAGGRDGQPRQGLPRSDDCERDAGAAIDYDRCTRILAAGNSDPKLVTPLACQLGLPRKSLRAIGVRFDPERDCWIFPETDWRRWPVGIVYRDRHGHRFCARGSKRGLTIPSDFRRIDQGPIYLCEGATDAAALHGIGALAIGRPSARLSKLARQWLTRLLRRLLRSDGDRPIIVIGDRDVQKRGKSPGSDGARDLAGRLSSTLDRPVSWALPAPGHKDVREQILSGQWHLGLKMRG